MARRDRARHARRARLIVLFGGQSAEHEVSCSSAFHVLGAIDPDRYEVEAIGITREGAWVRAGAAPAGRPWAGTLEAAGEEVAPLAALAAPPRNDLPVVAVPLLHGPMGEDGTIQGLLEQAGVPYVGSGVLGSALAMDKLKAKDVLAAQGLPQVRHLGLRDIDLAVAESLVQGAGLAYPLFVKPANLGSSVGVSRVGGPRELVPACELAAGYDEWVVIEEAVVGAREIEVGVLGGASPRASVPGEVIPSHEFYDYEDKYLDGAAGLVVPADLPPGIAAQAQELAVAAFVALRCDGMARVDLFYEQGGRGMLVNEVNTIPGFTQASMFPRLWHASGVPYPALVDELVDAALARHERRSRLSTKR